MRKYSVYLHFSAHSLTEKNPLYVKGASAWEGRHNAAETVIVYSMSSGLAPTLGQCFRECAYTIAFV